MEQHKALELRQQCLCRQPLLQRTQHMRIAVIIKVGITTILVTTTIALLQAAATTTIRPPARQRELTCDFVKK
jgi:hypothetical protein